MESNLIRIADALERIASALERFWPVYVTPTPVPNYTPPYIVPAFPFTSPTVQPYPNSGNTLVLRPSPPIDLSGDSDLANYRARGSSGDPA